MKLFLCVVLLGLFAGILGAAVNNGCPPGVNTVFCFVDPCMKPREDGCHGYPNAVCKADYCGDCNYDWYDNGQVVTCHAA